MKVVTSYFNIPFEPTIRAFSKEQAAKIWQVGSYRVVELEEDRSMLDSSMVESKPFKILPAQYFYSHYINRTSLAQYVCSDYTKFFNDYSSSSSDSDSSDDNYTLEANKKINKIYRKLFSDPEECREELKKYQQESLAEAVKELKLAEGEIPGITAACVKSVHEGQEFMQLLGGGCSNNVLQELEEASTSLQEVKWLDDLVASSMNMINQMQNDPEMQELMGQLTANTLFPNTEDDQLG